MPTLNNKKPFLKQIREMLSYGIQLIDDDKCDEAEALSMVARYTETSKGYVNPKGFVTYDKAMKMLGIRSRNNFKTLCDEHHIEQHTFNNQKIGFQRSEIEELRDNLREENKKKARK